MQKKFWLNSFPLQDKQLKLEVKYGVYYDNSSKSILTYLYPEDFLKLTLPSDCTLAKRYLDNRVKSYGDFSLEKFSEDFLPCLYIDDLGIIKDHEGRARSVLISNAGYEFMPVVLKLRNPIFDLTKIITKLTAQYSDYQISLDMNKTYLLNLDILLE